MDIGDVARLSKLAPSTLRFYEEKGLIKSIGRNGLRRCFGPDILEQLSLITLGQNVGLSLDEINKMLVPHGVKIDRELLLSKAEEFDKRITQMTAIRDGLRHGAVCQAPNHLACPKFRRFLNIAVKRWGKPKRNHY